VKELECSWGFYQENGSSTPSCHTWTDYQPSVSVALDFIVFFTALLGLLAALVVSTISIV